MARTEVDSLPAYRSTVSCPKCGSGKLPTGPVSAAVRPYNDPFSTAYVQGGMRQGECLSTSCGAAGLEHLHRRCSTCGFAHAEAVVDVA